MSALTEVTVKVLPAPEKQRTVMIPAPDVTAAHRQMITLMQGTFEIDGAAYLPAHLTARSGVDMVRAVDGALVVLRLTGSPGSVADRCAAWRSHDADTARELRHWPFAFRRKQSLFLKLAL